MSSAEKFLAECKRRLGEALDLDRGYLENLGYRKITVELTANGQLEPEYVSISGPGLIVPEGPGYRMVETVLKDLAKDGIHGIVVRRVW